MSCGVRTVNASSGLFRRHAAAESFRALQRDLIALRGRGESADNFTGFAHKTGILCADGVQNMRKFRQNKEPFAIAVEKKLRRNRAVQNQGGSHLPVAY